MANSESAKPLPLEPEFLTVRQVAEYLNVSLGCVYRLCTNFYRAPYYDPLQECYDNVASGIENAQDITISAGQIISDVNFVLGDGADLATIGGRVTSATGVPLAGVTLRVIRWPSTRPKKS